MRNSIFNLNGLKFCFQIRSEEKEKKNSIICLKQKKNMHLDCINKKK
jgi:hypothetical protein